MLVRIYLNIGLGHSQIENVCGTAYFKYRPIYLTPYLRPNIKLSPFLQPSAPLSFPLFLFTPVPSMSLSAFLSLPYISCCALLFRKSSHNRVWGSLSYHEQARGNHFSTRAVKVKNQCTVCRATVELPRGCDIYNLK